MAVFFKAPWKGQQPSISVFPPSPLLPVPLKGYVLETGHTMETLLLVIQSVSIQNNGTQQAHDIKIIFIAIALDESICLDVLHFPMKNIKSRDLEATPMCGATSKPIQ